MQLAQVHRCTVYMQLVEILYTQYICINLVSQFSLFYVIAHLGGNAVKI